MNTNTELQSSTSRTLKATVVVGVDGSSRNRSAVAWAQHEAARQGGQLVLVGASHDYTPPTPRFSADYADELFDEDTRKVLEGVRADLGGTEGDMPVWVARGGAQNTLLRAAERADLVVLGRRGMGAVKRMFVGSNSIAVAGRSPVPVVIVPDEWDSRENFAAPIVVGVDRSAKDDDVLTYAFTRARDLGVPLILVHAWQLPTVYVWSADDVKKWTQEVADELKTVLDSWKAKYPEVETMILAQDANAAMAIVDAAAIAQLVVLGRHTGPRHFGGFHVGSTTRSVLHHANCPVAVIPTSAPHVDEGVEDPDDAMPEFGSPKQTVKEVS
jgi:nucleotide-binding universal stress UspA family protein